MTEISTQTTDVAHQAVERTLAAYHASSAARGPRAQRLEEMAGGASTRRFFRVFFETGSLVAMFVPLPSQEIVKARQSIGIHSFVEVRQLLESRRVKVPRLFYEASEHQVLLVEDLGDDTLANYLSRAEHHREHLYQSAVADLARAQSALSTLPGGSIVLQRSFDEDLLRWEVDHFREWALEARGISLSVPQRQILDSAAQYLSATIASWPRGFVHRDYQSRNLMVRATDVAERPELVWIDFQDAMLGPRVYDLVALLTDSYQTFSREFVELRLAEFCREHGCVSDLEQVLYEFDLVTVQRKLKDAGRFVFIDRVNGNPNFLGFVDPTIQRARLALGRIKSPGPLQALDDLLYELFGSTR